MKLSLDLIVKAIWDGKGLDKGKKQLGGMEKAAKAFAAVGATALLAVAAATLKFAIDSTKAFTDFEKGMNEVFTLLPDISSTAMDSMKEDVLSFAQEAGKLPSEVVPAIYQAISAGVPQENVFDFMKIASDAALGGVTDLNTAVDGITSVVNAYGVETVNAKEASDLMFTAVRLGKTDFTQLSRFMFQVTPIASALGVEFGDVTAAMAAMTAQGTPTRVSATQIRQVLVELSKASSDTSKLFAELTGKGFKQFIAEGGNLQQALQTLEQSAKDSGLGINDLFSSVEAGNAALALTGRGTSAFTNALNEMETATGATAVAAETMAGSLSFLESQAAAATEAFKVQQGEALSPLKRSYLENKIAVIEYSTAINAAKAAQQQGLITASEFNEINRKLTFTSYDAADAMKELDLMTGGMTDATKESLEQTAIYTEKVEAATAATMAQQEAADAVALAERRATIAAEERTAAIEYQTLAIIDGNDEGQNIIVTWQMVKEAEEARTQATLDAAEADRVAVEALREHKAMLGDLFDGALQAADGALSLAEQLYNEANAAGAGATELAILAAATGNFTDEQIEAAFKAALMREQIQLLAEQVATGARTADDAVAALKLLQSGQAETAEEAGNMAAQTAIAQGELDGLTGSAIDAATALNDIPSEIPVHISITSDPIPFIPSGPQGKGQPPIRAAHGLTDFVVPPGFEDDTFPFFAQSGEVVNVTPKAQVATGNAGSRGNSGVVINMDLRGAQAGVGDEVLDALEIFSQRIGETVQLKRLGD